MTRRTAGWPAPRRPQRQERSLYDPQCAPQSCRSSPCKLLQVERRVEFEDHERMVDETLEPVQDGSANGVPAGPSPDTSAAAAVASIPPDSAANAGMPTAVEEHQIPFPEIHPSHTAIRTWRDFFVHITTIVIGLLIAIGLEQSVEYVHHRHQLQEARRELSKEVDDNRRIVDFNIESAQKASLALDTDIAVLRAQQASRSPVPKKLDYTWEPWDTRDGTWQAAKQSGSLSLMPHDELRRYSHVYAVLAAFMDALPAFGTRMEVARAIAGRAPDGNLSSRDIEELISATSEAQGRVALLSRLLHYARDGLQEVSHQ